MKCPYFNILFILIPSLSLPFVSSSLIHSVNSQHLMTAFIPMLGTKCSHGGNKVFPRGESSPKPMVLASNTIGFALQNHRF